MEETGQLLLRIWLADEPLDVTEAEYSALVACFEGAAWGSWQLDPLPPREDWPYGLAYLIDRLESEADTVTMPCDAWRRCRANFIRVKQRRLAAGLEPEAVENHTPADNETAGKADEPRPLRQREQAVLRILDHYGPELLTVAKITQQSESGEHGEEMAERTVGLAAKALMNAGLAERPMGRGEGMRLTKVGKKRAQTLPPATR